MKNIYVILTCLVLVVATIFGVYKFKTTSSSTSTFTHSSGAFSFNYPSNFFVIEKNNDREGGAVIFESKDSKLPLASVGITYNSGAPFNYKGLKESDMTIKNPDNLKTYVMIVPTGYETEYGAPYLFVPLEDTQIQTPFLTSKLFPNKDMFSKEQFDLMFKSIVVDKGKAAIYIKDVLHFNK